MQITQNFQCPEGYTYLTANSAFAVLTKKGGKLIIQVRGRQWKKQREDNFKELHGGCSFNECANYKANNDYDCEGCPYIACKMRNLVHCPGKGLVDKSAYR